MRAGKSGEKSPMQTVDLDDDQHTTLTDALLLMRCSLGTYPRDQLNQGIPASTTADTVQRRFGEITQPARITATGRAVLDINQDGTIHPLDDGLLIAHYIHNRGWGSSQPTAAQEYGVIFGDINAQLNALCTF